MEITEVRIKLMPEGSDKLRAFCSITIDDDFVVRDLKVIEGSRGPFVAMPSRKLTERCPRCKGKNHYRAAYCNDCGEPLPRRHFAPPQDTARMKLHADIAHPINSRCREIVQARILAEYGAELDRAKDPDYRPADLDVFDEDYLAEETGDLVALGEEARPGATPGDGSDLSPDGLLHDPAGSLDRYSHDPAGGSHDPARASHHDPARASHHDPARASAGVARAAGPDRRGEGGPRRSPWGQGDRRSSGGGPRGRAGNRGGDRRDRGGRPDRGGPGRHGARAQESSPRQHPSRAGTFDDPPRALHDPPRVLHDPARVLHDPARVLHDPARVLHDPARASHPIVAREEPAPREEERKVTREADSESEDNFGVGLFS